MKVLIIGLGSIGKKHISAIKQIDYTTEIYALRSKSNAEQFLDVINIYRIEEIAETPIDFAIISNPTSEHRKTIEILSRYKFPLFIEKPLDASIAIEEFVDSVAKSGIQTYVACNLRFLDCIKYVKQRFANSQNKRLNEVNVYCGSYLPDWRPNSDYKKSYSAISELGGGVHIDLIHEIDYIYWLFGEPNDVKRTFKSQSTLSIPTIDYANYVFEYNGFCTNIVLNYYRRDPKRILELIFEDETWVIDLLKNQITCNNKEVYTSKQLMSDTYYQQMEYFIESLQNKTNTFNTISDAFKVLKICLGK